MTIEVLLNTPPQQGVKRIGDIGKNAPYVMLYAWGQEKMIVQMPITVTSRNNILWDEKNFTEGTIVGSASLDAFNAEYNNWGDAANKAGSVGGSLYDALKRNTQTAGGALLNIDSAGDLMLHQKGKTINPNKELMFLGMNFRAFTFEWEFIPTNREQADQLLLFIYTIQHQSAAGFSGGTTYLSYPGEWQIVFEPQEYLPLMMKSYLTDYNINYGGVGRMVFHEGGAPIQTNISCTFTESQLHTRDQIETGYWG